MRKWINENISFDFLFAVKISIIYILIGGLWIIFFDNLLAIIVEDAKDITKFQTYKGWFFIIVTATFLFFLIQKETQKIKKSEKSFRSLFQSNPQPMWIYDLETLAFLEVNDAAIHQYGYTKDEFLSMTIKDIRPQEDVPRLLENVREVTGEVDEAGILRHIKKDRSLIYVETISHTMNFNNRKAELVIAKDITDKKLIEKELEKSKQEWTDIFQAIGHLTLILDLDYKILAANRAAAKAMSMSEGELIGKKCYEAFHGTKEPPPNCPMAKSLATNNFETSEMEVEAIGGYYLVSCTPVFSEKGDLQKIIHIATDITERKCVEGALRESEERFRRITENASDIIYRFRLKPLPCFEFINNAVKEIAGYSPEEYYDDPLIGLRIIHPEDRPQLEKFLAGSLIKRPHVQRWFRKDGKIIWIEDRYTPIYDENGDLTAVEGVARDITQQKLIEEALRTERDKVQKYLDVIGVILLVINKDQKVELINKKGCEILGYDEKEIIGKNWIDNFIPDEDREELRKKFYLVFNSSEMNIDDIFEHGFVNSVITKSRDKRIIKWSNTVIKDKKGIIISTLSSGEDVTLIKEFEKEKKQAEKELEKSLKDMRALANRLQTIREEERTMIAREIHDELGQALTVLKIDLSWLIKKLPIENRELLEKIKSMMGFIDSIIRTIQKISAELRPGILDDLGLTAAVSWQADEFQKRTGIECNIIKLDEFPYLEKQKSTTLFRILQEALTNIARHAQASYIEISLWKESQNIIMEIRDNGIGIKDEQIHDSSSIGIIGMYERVRSQNGNLTIVGKKAKGTVLTVELPLS